MSCVFENLHFYNNSFPVLFYFEGQTLSVTIKTGYALLVLHFIFYAHVMLFLKLA